MDDNRENKSWWIFTFGVGHEHENHYVRIYGTYTSAREVMFDKYGDKWAFQYSEEWWNKWERERPPYILIEKLLEEINPDTEDKE